MNRFKGLDPVDRMSEELWTEICNTVQETVNKTIPQRKKKQRRKGKIYPSECRVPKNTKEI